MGSCGSSPVAAVRPPIHEGKTADADVPVPRSGANGSSTRLAGGADARPGPTRVSQPPNVVSDVSVSEQTAPDVSEDDGNSPLAAGPARAGRRPTDADAADDIDVTADDGPTAPRLKAELSSDDLLDGVRSPTRHPRGHSSTDSGMHSVLRVWSSGTPSATVRQLSNMDANGSPPLARMMRPPQSSPDSMGHRPSSPRPGLPIARTSKHSSPAESSSNSPATPGSRRVSSAGIGGGARSRTGVDSHRAYV